MFPSRRHKTTSSALRLCLLFVFFFLFFGYNKDSWVVNHLNSLVGILFLHHICRNTCMPWGERKPHNSSNNRLIKYTDSVFKRGPGENVAADSQMFNVSVSLSSLTTSDLHQLCLCVLECSSFIWRQGGSQAARQHSYNTHRSRTETQRKKWMSTSHNNLLWSHTLSIHFTDIYRWKAGTTTTTDLM